MRITRVLYKEHSGLFFLDTLYFDKPSVCFCFVFFLYFNV